MKRFAQFAVLLAVTSAAGWTIGQEVQPVEAPATQPATRPAAPTAKISPAAVEVINGMAAVYGKLDSLQLAGSVWLNVDAAGDKVDDKSEFTGVYQAPASFRHDMKDDLLIVSNGAEAYLYKQDMKQYASIDPIKQRVAVSELPQPLGPALQQQNPSLLLAMVSNPGEVLSQGADTVERSDDVAIDGTNYQSLVIKAEGQEMHVLVHPQTHLLRKVTIDVSKSLVAQGVPDVKSATLTVEYTKSDAGKAAEGAFAWTPPADAVKVPLSAPAGSGGTGEDAPAMALVGKPAPAFSLKGVDDVAVTMASLKGKVVVLDFWATWCGPCVMAMPHLDALNKEMAPRGVKVFAVNEGETKEQAQKFMEEKKFGLPVLLDPDGEGGKAFLVNGIPQTVVIGKDGAVQKVFIGYGPGLEDQIKAAVEAAMK